MSVNKAILIGRLGADPEVRYTQSGTAVANFNIATSENYTDKSGQRQERTEWHRIVVWNRLAEICGEYLRKGREVYVEGRIETREWQDRDGNRRFTTEIKAQSVTFLGSQGQGAGAGGGGGNFNRGAGQSGGAPGGGGNFNRGGGGGGGGGGGYQGGGGGGFDAPANNPAPASPPGGDFNDDDIPF